MLRRLITGHLSGSGIPHLQMLFQFLSLFSYKHADDKICAKRVQLAACGHMRNKQHAPHILFSRLLLGLMQLCQHRYDLPIRLLKQQMQPRPMHWRNMQQPSCTNMRNKHYTAHI